MSIINKIDVVGSFDEQLDKNILDQIEKIYKNITPTSEFEFLFFKSKNQTDVMFSENYVKILRFLSAISKRDKLPITKSVSLDINYTSQKNNTTYRITLNTLETIVEKIKLLHQKNNHAVFSNLIKESKNNKNIVLMKKVRDNKNIVDILDFNMRLKLSEEKELTDKEIKELENLSYEEQENITFRYKQRVSLQVEKTKNTSISIDLTEIKMSNHLNNVKNGISTYELEIELASTGDNLPKSHLVVLYKNITLLLKVIQDSNFIIKKSLQKDVLNNYANLLGENASHLTKLIGRQPESLEIQHSIDILPNKYAVTDKADGDRYALIVYNGVVFLISKLLHVKNTGIILEKKLEVYNDTLLDGELIFIAKEGRHVFMCFDCLYFCNTDVRQLPYLIDRLKKADELIAKCLIFKNQTGYPMKEYDGKFDMDSIMKYYDVDITECMKALNNDIKKDKVYPLIRRKYFIFALGGLPNEIFKYSSLIWNKYTKDKNVNCPYLLDGLIYQPVDQKYVDAKSSKYKDYKWKPNDKNSIDFYVLFERDRKTGNIVTLYDNSQIETQHNDTEIDINGSQVGFKPYKILNLYVGRTFKNKETPVPFEPEKDSVKNLAYLYLDNNEIRDISGDIIVDGTVVEFYYNTDPNIPDKYRWTPIKTRYDKTEAVLRFGVNYGNYYNVANMVWRSIKNPFSIGDINILSNDDTYAKHTNILRGKIDHSIILSERKENEYSQLKSRLSKPMRNFNNWVKSILVYTYINSVYEQGQRQLSAMDIECGVGVDIMKYYYGKVEFCINIDHDSASLLSPTDGAISRYNQLKKTHPNFPRMYFVRADASALLNYESQSVVLGGMSDQNKELIEKLFSIGKEMKVDRINCHKIQQFMENSISWNNFCINVNTMLNNGGYFMGTCLDAGQIMKILSGKKNYSVYYNNDKGEQNLLFDIIKKYNDDDIIGPGMSIEYFNSLEMQEDNYEVEYLVNIDFMKKEFEKYDMELVDSGLFEDLYIMNKDFFVNKYQYESKDETKKFFKDVSEYFTDMTEINMASKKLTQLMRYYVFRKKDNVKDNKKIKGGDKHDDIVKEIIEKNKVTKIHDTKIIIKNKKLIKRDIQHTGGYSFFNCIHNVLQNGGIIPKEYTNEEFYKDVNIDLCMDKDINNNIVDTLQNNLIVKHDYDGGKETTAFGGMNIAVINNGGKVDVMGKVNVKLPTILMTYDGSKYSVLYDKNNALFNTKTKFIKDVINNNS